MERLVADMETLLDEAGMTEPVAVVGLSMGAATALHFGLAYPQRVRALILASYPPGPADPAGISSRADDFAEVIEHQGLEAAGARFIWGPESGLPSAMIAQVRAGFLEHTGPGLAGILRGVLAKLPEPADLAQPLAETLLPTLLLHGERDAPSARASRAIGAGNPSADDKRIPDAGHVVNLDQPERFNAVLRDFLDRR